MGLDVDALCSSSFITQHVSQNSFGVPTVTVFWLSSIATAKLTAQMQAMNQSDVVSLVCAIIRDISGIKFGAFWISGVFPLILGVFLAYLDF